MANQKQHSTLHLENRKGRGAVSNRDSRYHRQTRHQFDDGWDTIDQPAPPLRTELTADNTKSIIARNQSPDLGFDRSINPYRGCEHGCIYCFARPTHAYLGLSPGQDFESRLLFKPAAAKLLEKALRAPRYRCRQIAMGTNTDPYQPIERHMKITRSIIEILHRFKHPLGIVTKSYGVTRDIDLLAAMAELNLVKVRLSITSLDPRLARTMEPRAAAPSRRMRAIEELAKAGIPTGVMVAPVVPGLNDHEMEDILAAAYERGAREAGYIVLRLPLEIKDLWDEWIETHYPNHRNKVANHLKSMHDGELYRAEFSHRLRGKGPFADLLENRFEKAVRRLGYQRNMAALDITKFSVPKEPDKQMTLF